MSRSFVRLPALRAALRVQTTICIAAFLTLLSAITAFADSPVKPPNDNAAGSKHWSELVPVIGEPSGFGNSPELVKLGPGQPGVPLDELGHDIPMHLFRRSLKAQGAPSLRDPVIQTSAPVKNTPGPTTSFEGIPNVDGFTPPDTVGAIGPSNFVQAVNVRVQVFNRFTGAAQTAALAISALFTNLGGGSLCASTDDGDPVVLYDQYADRWLIAQFANASSTTGPYYMSIAISKTSDPTGAYYAYCFQTPGVKFPDYPKIGVWGDGYYMAVNQFNGAGTSFLGVGVYAFDRAKMLVGDATAKFIYYDLNSVDPTLYAMLPASAEGPLPPVGTPNYFTCIEGTSLGNTADRLRLFQFHADFANTNLASFTERSESPISVAAFSAFSPNTPAVPQSGTAQKLDSLADRLMFRLQYRNFGTNESLVVNHTATGGSSQAAVRYYQLRRNFPAGTFAVNEQATYAPDALHRWMGSAAMNFRGDLAVGYSVCSGTTFPSIRYAARLATDPPNGLFQGEATMITGGGAQTSTGNRWGDYSCMTIDPVDDCTFWYTQMYYATTSTGGWQTRIGSFSLTNLVSPRATIQGTVTRASNGQPVSNAVVRTASGYFRTTKSDGTYSFTVTPGTNDVTAFSAGIGTNTVNNLAVTNGEARVQNFVLGTVSTNPVITAVSSSLTSESCTTTNGVIDPGETVTVSLVLRNDGAANTSNLVATLQGTGGVTSPSAAQSYGVVSTNGTTVARSFTFTAVGICGSNVTATLQLQDGALDLGTVTFNFQMGTIGVFATENFDGVTTPALPAGWSSTAGGGESAWVSVTTASDTAPNALFSPDPATTGSNQLLSAVFALPSGASQLTFRHRYELESTFDGGVLEIRVNGGAFADIITAGGSFAGGGYVATLSSGNPFGARSAWTGTNASFSSVVVNLPPSAAGQNVQFRWRCASDSSVSRAGWWIDSVSISGALCCAGAAPPSISAQPQSQSVASGANATFNVTAVGSGPLAYQWRFNGVNIAGANTNSYTRSSVTTNDAGNYTVVITNPYPPAVTSSVAVLTVTVSPPVITAQPQSQTVFVGGAANFSVTATGSAPLAYQWRSNGVDIAGATLTNLTLANVQASFAANYSVVVSNSLGMTNSANAALTVTTGYSGVLAGWEMNAVSSFGTSPMAPTTNAPNITVVGLTRGSGVTTGGTAAARAWGGAGWDSANAAAAVTAGDLATFSITANAGYIVSFSAVSAFNYRRSGSGATAGVLAYQVGAGLFTDISNLTYSTSSSSGAALPAIDLSGISALQNIPPGTNVTFRIANYAASASGGTWYVYDVGPNAASLDFAVQGSVASVVSSNPPAAAPVLTNSAFAAGQFQFTVTGTAGSNYIVQCATNLTGSNWVSLRTNPAPFQFTETNVTQFPSRFYRGVVGP